MVHGVEAFTTASGEQVPPPAAPAEPAEPEAPAEPAEPAAPAEPALPPAPLHELSGAPALTHAVNAAISSAVARG
ncbi:MAG: hypothetical protein U0165_06385 [Polyangiaceae bacterium]